MSSRQVGEELLNTRYATQHSDSTSRNGQKVVDFEMTMNSGATRTIGLVDVAGGDAETQLDALKFTLSKLSDLLDDDDGLHEYLFVEKDMVVVAFEDDWYVGEVVKLISETVGSINYMHHSATNHK